MDKNIGFTPGPWEIHGSLAEPLYYVHGANAICDMRKPSGFYRSPAETEANARLIAAAPELLEALEWIADHGDTEAHGRSAVHAMRTKARSAIAKVEGRE